MSTQEKINQLLPGWLKNPGPEGGEVLSSRIRLARNIKAAPFPHYAGEKQLEEVIKLVEKACRRADPEIGALKLVRLDEMSQLDRMTLLEKHLISPGLVNNPTHRAVVIREDEVLAVMVNEEDHLRIQVLNPGLQLEPAWRLASKVDDYFEAVLDFAFDEGKGYLTCCPTNVGTGLRASVMTHLPALAMVEQVRKVLSTLSQVGLNVRGVYGEGSESWGNLFQISNQVTLGYSEEDLVSKLTSVTRQVVEQERMAREVLLKESRAQLEDRVHRAYGLISQARLISSQEAVKLLSDVWLGVETGLLSEIDSQTIKELFFLNRVAILQKLIGRELDPGERDYYRAAMIRSYIKEKED